MKNHTIAVIPARGGSKRIIKKNIRLFCGSEIISYPIKAALESRCFTKVVVSTDNKEIAEIAKANGAEIPFHRSETNSDDYATLSDVMEETILNFKELNISCKYICCILPTSPLLAVSDLRKGYEVIKQPDVDSVVTVTKYEYPIERSLVVRNNYLSFTNSEYINTRSNDLEDSYHDVGQFYWLNTDNFLSKKSFFMEKTRPLILSHLNVQDIDTEEDWKLAEIKYHSLRLKGV